VLVPLSGSPRLLLDRDSRETLDEYPGVAGVRGRALIDVVEHVGLLGRGGAGFPTGVKMRSVADRVGPRTVVANGDEGEPLALKDRYLLRVRPQLVLDGLLRAAEAVVADRAVVYLSDTLAEEGVRAALAELGDLPLPVDVVRVPRSYVGGEETAVVRAVDGGPALPTDKPPRPFEAGVGGGPTLVLNVETLARLPAIAAGCHVDSVLVTVTGPVRRPGLHEVPVGTPLGPVVEAMGEPRAFLMGGYFAGLLGPRALDLPLDFTALREEGSGLGCGAVAVIGPQDCPVAAAADVMAYFDRENAEQCGPCIRGTAAMAQALAELAAGSATDDRLRRLRGWSASLRGRGACATLDGACNLVSSLFREFPNLVEDHQARPCPLCAGVRATPVSREAPDTDPRIGPGGGGVVRADA
jgi:NADH:ubiquinone oxidoreductase subunit F (NADH-binding)